MSKQIEQESMKAPAEENVVCSLTKTSGNALGVGACR